jgi:hypothetical protein
MLPVDSIPVWLCRSGAAAESLAAKQGEKGSGTCEKIGFIRLGTMHFQWFTLWITGRNSIFSHVPGTFF